MTDGSIGSRIFLTLHDYVETGEEFLGRYQEKESIVNNSISFIQSKLLSNVSVQSPEQLKRPPYLSGYCYTQVTDVQQEVNVDGRPKTEGSA
ncbi:hypothetical protein JOD82_005759 [Paenibacillus sp. 1182]|nr:hypothetical protein [Paenibacillus sp. 1182]